MATLVDAPVAVVPASWVEGERRVVTVGFDPDAPDEVALRTAMTLARLRDAVLRVLVAGSRCDVDDGWPGSGATPATWLSRPWRATRSLRSERRPRPRTCSSSAGIGHCTRRGPGSEPWAVRFSTTPSVPCC